MRILFSLLTLCTLMVTGCTSDEPVFSSTLETVESVGSAPETSRPNFVIILADDVGFAELGAYGSEIPTPNINSLADRGIQFTSFYVAPNCSPTRAMMLSGADNHLVGLGSMGGRFTAENQRGIPGYEGYLNESALAFTELLDDAGYRNYMAGKWHQGYEENQLPDSRGFDRYVVQLAGAPRSHFDLEGTIAGGISNFIENGETNLETPEGFYSSDFYTDKLIEYMDAEIGSDQPFLAYLAFTATHYPLHAPETYIEQQRGRYDQGYEEVRNARFQRQQQMGIIPEAEQLAGSPPTMPNWDELSDSEKAIQSRIMEVYAGMTVNMDDNVGRLLDYLRTTEQDQNTHIIFLSDNGPAGLHSPIGKPAGLGEPDNSLDNLGLPGSYYWYGPGWASAGATPFRLFKRQVAEGGIRVPAIWKAAENAGSSKTALVFNHHTFTVRDIAPTILELAGIELIEAQYKGRDIVPISGLSLVPLLSEPSAAVHSESENFGIELFTRRALRVGDWKILRLDAPFGNDNWQLYNLAEDPIESLDLAQSNPEKLAEMLSRWEEFQNANNVIVGVPPIIPPSNPL